MEKNQNLEKWPQVAFIILNWNQVELTSECIRSLRNQNYKNFKVILVDNGSTDGSQEILRNNFPEITLIENPINVGYSQGNNVGIAHALEENPDYVFLLNNDTIVDPNMLLLLVEKAESSSDIGATGPTMYYYDRPNVIWSAGGNVDVKTGHIIHHRANESDSGVTKKQQAVNFIVSCGICIKKQALEEVGLIDDKFFIYYDEIDWCLRAIKHGWKIEYVSEAKLWHKISASMGKTSPATDYYMIRNRLIFLRKHSSGLTRFNYITKAILRETRVILAYTVKNHNGIRIPNRNARLLGLRDALVGRVGKMGADVAAVCYPND